MLISIVTVTIIAAILYVMSIESSDTNKGNASSGVALTTNKRKEFLMKMRTPQQTTKKSFAALNSRTVGYIWFVTSILLISMGTTTTTLLAGGLSLGLCLTIGTLGQGTTHTWSNRRLHGWEHGRYNTPTLAISDGIVLSIAVSFSYYIVVYAVLHHVLGLFSTVMPGYIVISLLVGALTSKRLAALAKTLPLLLVASVLLVGCGDDEHAWRQKRLNDQGYPGFCQRDTNQDGWHTLEEGAAVLYKDLGPCPTCVRAGIVPVYTAASDTSWSVEDQLMKQDEEAWLEVKEGAIGHWLALLILAGWFIATVLDNPWLIKSKLGKVFLALTALGILYAMSNQTGASIVGASVPLVLGVTGAYTKYRNYSTRVNQTCVDTWGWIVGISDDKKEFVLQPTYNSDIMYEYAERLMDKGYSTRCFGNYGESMNAGVYKRKDARDKADVYIRQLKTGQWCNEHASQASKLLFNITNTFLDNYEGDVMRKVVKEDSYLTDGHAYFIVTDKVGSNGDPVMIVVEFYESNAHHNTLSVRIKLYGQCESHFSCEDLASCTYEDVMKMWYTPVIPDGTSGHIKKRIADFARSI